MGSNFMLSPVKIKNEFCTELDITLPGLLICSRFDDAALKVLENHGPRFRIEKIGWDNSDFTFNMNLPMFHAT